MSNNAANASLNVVPSSASGADPVLEWDAIATGAIAANASSPAAADHALAIESLAVYDAVAAVEGTTGFQSDLTAPSGASAQAAVVVAADAALDALYPTEAAAFDAQAAADLNTGGPAESEGAAVGQQAAAQVLATAGGGASVTGTGDGAPGSWQPTAPFYAPALIPTAVTLFGSPGPGQFSVAAPPAIGSAAYAVAANQTYNLGALNSTTRGAAETQQALFWNDPAGTGTTAGEWNQIAAAQAQSSGDSLAQDAQLFAELNVAEADSAAVAANAALIDDTPRPITLFTNPGLAGLNPAIKASATWTPLLETPNSPEYPEGLAASSAAAAAVLGSFFGANTPFSATSESEPGVTLPFSSFSAAASQAAMSEVYGGIAFTFSATAGLSLGTQAGNWALGLFGTATTPTVTLTGPSGGASNIDPTVTGFVSSGVTALNARLPGGSIITVPVTADGAFSYTVPDQLGGTADGGQVVSFTAINAAGDQSPVVDYTFALLTRAPTITLAAESVTNNGTIGAGAVLAGTIGLEAGDTLRSLTYAFDGGAAIPVAVEPATGAFDAPLDDATLTPGPHQLTVMATDIAGNTTTQTLAFTDAPPPFTLTGITPAAGANDAGVTFRPAITFSRAVNPATLNSSDFYATDSTGAVLPATIVPFADGTGATLIPSADFSAESSITLHVVGQGILAAADNAPLDAAGAGMPGTSLTESYSTVSTVPAAGTTISGLVVDPGPDGTPFTADDVTSSVGNPSDFASDLWKLPIAGAKVYVLGDEANAVTTAANGSFTLTNVPAGNAVLVVDGTTATNAAAGYAFPTMSFAVDVRQGEANTVGGDLTTPTASAGTGGDPAIYLPRLASDALTPVSGSAPVTVTAPADSELGAGSYAPALVSLTIQPSGIVAANGAALTNPNVGIVPVPASVVQDLLPPGAMQNSFMVSIQAPGAALFTTGASMTLPNTLGLAPGEQTFVFSLDPTTGQAEAVGTATVAANGQTVTTDPGTRISGPGMYGMASAGANGTGGVGEASPGANSIAIVNAEVQAGQAALALVTQANLVVAQALAPGAAVAGMVGATTGSTAGLAFASAAGVASDVASAIAGIGADWQTIKGDPAAAAGFAALAADALHDASNIAAELGGALPAPTDQWAADLPAARAGVTFLEGMESTDAALPADLAHMPNGGSFNGVLGVVNVDVSDQLAIYQRVASDLTTLSVLDGLNLTVPGLGIPAGQLASIDEQLPAIVNAFDDYMAAAQQIAGQPTALGLAEQVANGLAAAESVTNATAFQPIAAASGGPADNALGASARDPDSTLYAAIQGSDGSIQRLSFNASTGYQFFFAPNTVYQVTVFDPATNAIGGSIVESGTSGQDTRIPVVGLAADPAAKGADGLTPTEAFVIGVNNATADNLVPGITDLAALQQGLYRGAVQPGATGIVAASPLGGSAQAVTLAGSSDGSTTYAYIATGNDGLAVVDVTNPDQPVVLGQIGLGGNATGVAVSSALGIAALANGGDLALIDVGDPRAPMIVQTIAVSASAVEIIDGLAYVNNGGAIDSFDLATGAPVQVLSLGTADISGLAVSGATLYAMDVNDDLKVIDTSSGSMVLDGSVTLPAGGNQIFAADGIVYAGAANGAAQGGYVTVDVSNPAAPALIAGASDTAIAGAALAVDGSGTGVSVQQTSASGSLLSVFGAANPANTGQAIARYTLPAAPAGVALDDGTALVADGTGGLQVVNYLPTDTSGVAPVIAAVNGPDDVDPNTAGTQVYAGAPVTVGGTVSDASPVREVELLLNGTAVASTEHLPFALTAMMPSIANAATLQIEAIDTGGNTTLSAPIPVQIVPDMRAFSLRSENVTQGGTVDPFIHAITLSFSKPIDPLTVTGSDVALINQGSMTVAPQSVTLSDANQIVSLNFGTLAAGLYDLVLDAPLITDDNGDSLSSGTVATQFTVEQFTATFTSAAGGDWSTAGNWSTGAVPGPADTVSIGANGGAIAYNDNDSVTGLVLGATGQLNVNGGGLTVTNLLQVNGLVVSGGGALAATGSVSIGAPGAIDVNNRSTSLNNVAIAAGGSVQVSNNNYLYAGGTYANAGLIGLGSVNNDTRIVVPGDLTLTNTGAVQLSDNANNSITSNGNPATLNNAGNTIEGSGQIGDGGNLTLNNEVGGTIAATGTNASLTVFGGNDTNAGLMEGTGPAPFVLRSASITGPGTIAAPAAGSTVNLQSSAIIGGTIQDANGGVVQVIDRGSSIDDGTLSAGSNLQITNNNFLTAVGTLTNAGTVDMDSSNNLTSFVMAGSVTLAGTGTVQLSDNANNTIFTNGAAATLTNAGNTIQGAGQIGDGSLTLNNAAGGTIAATGTNNSLILFGGNDSNAGLLEATGPAPLILRSASIGGPGTIAAPTAGSTVNLQSSSITGGTLEDSNGGIIQSIDRGSSINGVTLTAGSNLQITNNNFLYAVGTLTNDGTVDLDSRNNLTSFVMVGAVTLTGTGAVQLSDNANNSIVTNGNAATLTNVGNTIEGAGQIGDGLLTLNIGAGGTIDSTGAANSLIIYGANVTNAGLIEGTGAAALLLHSTAITSSGTIAAPTAGSSVNLQSSSITGGTLEDTGGGVMQVIDRGSSLDNVTLTSGGNFYVPNNEYLTIAGALTNSGTVYLNSGNNDTRLISNGGVTLGGGGVVQLSDNANNLISGNAGAVLLNVDNTIEGAGQIGDGVLTISNGVGGTINATGNNNQLILTGLPVTNAGLIEDTGPAGLRIRSTTIDNSGTIAAPLSGSSIDLQSATIVGGVLDIANGGVIYETDRGSLLDNVAVMIAVAGMLVVQNNEYLTLAGTLTNQGTVVLASTNNDTRLIASGSVTLAGGGLIQLSDNGNNSLTSNGAPAVLINTDNVIAGAGQIGDGDRNLAVINDQTGLIDASGDTALVIDVSGGTLTNFGTIEATSTVAGNGGLLIANSTIDNSGSNNAGVILSTGSNSHVNLQSAVILGGTLAAAQGGVFEAVDRGSVLDDVTLSTDSNLQITNNNFITVVGTLTNEGAVDVNSGNNTTWFIAAGSVTLTGSGTIQMTDNGGNAIVSNGTAATLNNINNTIEGAGQIGDGLLTLNNTAGGTIAATGTNNSLVLSGRTITNAGLLEGTGPAPLVLRSTSITSTGTIAALTAGSSVDLQSSSITGGTLEDSNGGVIQSIDRGSTIDSVTLTAGSNLQITNNNFLTAVGTVTNDGMVGVDSSNNPTWFVMAGSITLAGTGVVRLSDNANNSIVSNGTATTLINAGNIIQGSGQIGDADLTIDNTATGTIDATGSNAQLILADGIPVASAGLLEATGPAGLRISGTTINNTGTIAAPNAGSVVDLATATITGGLMTDGNGGVIQAVDRGSTLNGVTIAAGAVVAVVNDQYLALAGAVTNQGTIEVDSSGNDTRALFDPGLTLTGGGVVQLTDNGNNSISSGAANAAVSILNDTVEGAGVFGDGGMTVTLGANGVITATGNNTLTLNTGGNIVTNGGLLELEGAGGLSVTGGGGVANSGTIWADGDGLYVAGDVSGTGSDRITGGTTLRIGGTVASGQNISFDPGSTGTLRLDDSQQFSGTVFGLATTGTNALDLSDISFINPTSTTASYSSGVLTVTDGSHTATIALAGDYTGQSFVTSSDGHNGTTVIDPDPPTPGATWASTLLGSMVLAHGRAMALADTFATGGSRETWAAVKPPAAGSAPGGYVPGADTFWPAQFKG